MTQEPRVLPRPATAPVREAESVPDGLWTLVLLDDDDHTYEYVIGMLGDLFGYSAEKAFALARLVDTQGRVIVLTGGHEACRDGQQRIHAYGPDPRLPRCRGSMSAVVEPLGSGA